MDKKKYEKMILSIKGWHHPPDFFQTAKIVKRALSKRSDLTEKNFIEIGIYHGRSFLPICDYFYNDISTFYACDYFQDDAQPEHFNYHLEKNLPGGYESKVKIVSDDSMNLPKRFPLGEKKFIYCSIDGNHSYNYTMSDIKFCAERLEEGGIIILDDVFQYMWPEISNAMFNFLYENPEFRIGFILYNKVILCKDANLIDDLYDPAVYDRQHINGHIANVIKPVPDESSLTKVKGIIPRMFKRLGIPA